MLRDVINERPLTFFPRNPEISSSQEASHRMPKIKLTNLSQVQQFCLSVFLSFCVCFTVSLFAALAPTPFKYRGDLKSDQSKSGKILNPDILKVRFQMVGLQLWLQLQSKPFKIRTFLPIFQMVFDKMAAICPDFRWSCFQIPDPIQNPGQLQPNLFLTIQNPDYQDFKSPNIPHFKL